jgi:large subunit ribosomal protein L23
MHVLKPRLSEKAYGTAQATNTYVIDVPGELNKQEIAASVEQQFEVSVKSVRTINRKGKAKRIMNTTGKRASNRKGRQSAIKKAYITLNAGSHLPFFEAEEAEAAEAVKTAEKTKKTDKKTDAKASKAPKEEKN